MKVLAMAMLLLCLSHLEGKNLPGRSVLLSLPLSRGCPWPQGLTSPRQIPAPQPTAPPCLLEPARS